MTESKLIYLAPLKTIPGLVDNGNLMALPSSRREGHLSTVIIACCNRVQITVGALESDGTVHSTVAQAVVTVGGRGSKMVMMIRKTGVAEIVLHL